MLVGTKTKISGLAERGRSISPDENSSRAGTETREGSPQFVEEAYPIGETVEEVLEEAMEEVPFSIPKQKHKKKRHPSADLYE
jgi:hypothetical protein